MSQEQPRKTEEEQQPVNYGDVFPVSGNLAEKAITPEDAAMMQSAEARVFGQTQKGGPAAVMESAACKNERAGLVAHGDVTYIVGEEGVTVTDVEVPGQHVIIQSIAGQVIGQYTEPNPMMRSQRDTKQSEITIGEALQATCQTAGNKPVEQSDAAAIQAAEVRATGSSVIVLGGLSASAQSAAAYNEGIIGDQDKIKLSSVLRDATTKLAIDKAVTRDDAEGVMSAELRNHPGMPTYPGGVAASVAAAARLNERDQR
ncbi:hypothetical protein Leryth_008247 [Lithospermum erythrorhizon]|nr:hypothetical protein Leryth_008247 [Lithospermum erythrorhizon]